MSLVEYEFSLTINFEGPFLLLIHYATMRRFTSYNRDLV